MRTIPNHALLFRRELIYWALYVVSAIGPEAAEAVPEIVQYVDVSEFDLFMYTSGTLLEAAIQALTAIGPAASEALPYLENLGEVEEIRSEVAQAIQKIRGTISSP